MNIAISISIFVVLLACIITLQIFYFKREQMRFFIPSVLIGIGGIITSLALSTYYNVALENAKANLITAFMDMAEFQEKLQNFEHYSVICLFAALIFLASILVSVAILIIKKFILNRDEFSDDFNMQDIQENSSEQSSSSDVDNLNLNLKQ